MSIPNTPIDISIHTHEVRMSVPAAFPGTPEQWSYCENQFLFGTNQNMARSLLPFVGGDHNAAVTMAMAITVQLRRRGLAPNDGRRFLRYEQRRVPPPFGPFQRGAGLEQVASVARGCRRHACDFCGEHQVVMDGGCDVCHSCGSKQQLPSR